MSKQPPYLRTTDVLRQRIAVGANGVRRTQELLISQGFPEGLASPGTYVAEARQYVCMARPLSRERRAGLPFHAVMDALGRCGTRESRAEAKMPMPAGIATRLGCA